MERYLGENVPKLGFGLMRLPMKGKNIDVEQTKEMVDLFMDAGYTYFDTAYGYNGGESERAIKTALVDRYPRESYQLATKLPAWEAKSRADIEQMFATSLERTGAGYFDFYLLHNLGADRTHFFDDYDAWNFVQEKKKEGLIRHVGFSIHDSADKLEEVLQAHPEMEFVQLQINYADWESISVQSRRCYEVARKYGKPVIIMEPVKGGALNRLPEKSAKILLEARPERSVASWAIRFAAGLEGIIAVLSGMSDLTQVRDNLATMNDFTPLDEAESAALRKALDILSSVPTVPCTGCEYCAAGCPQHVAIADSFSSYNLYQVFGNIERAKESYGWPIFGRGLSRASACIECGACEAVCPQHISIIEELKKASAVLDN